MIDHSYTTHSNNNSHELFVVCYGVVVCCCLVCWMCCVITYNVISQSLQYTEAKDDWSYPHNTVPSWTCSILNKIVCLLFVLLLLVLLYCVVCVLFIVACCVCCCSILLCFIALWEVAYTYHNYQTFMDKL